MKYLALVYLLAGLYFLAAFLFERPRRTDRGYLYYALSLFAWTALGFAWMSHEWWAESVALVSLVVFVVLMPGVRSRLGRWTEVLRRRSHLTS